MNTDTVDAPANSPAPSWQSQLRPPAPARESASQDSPINILIVDDEPRNLTVLETVLDDPGYRLVRATTAEQALRALVAEEFALLILDIRMPDMTGFELAQIIKDRKKTAQVPIIFLTAYYNEDQHVLEGYGSGAVDYLHKPVNPAILRSKVAVFAALHHMNRESAIANRALQAEVIERRRAEEQLREVNEKLRGTVEELETFTYGIAHDLRAPLRSLEGFSSALLTDHSSQLDDAGRHSLTRIAVSAKAMGMFITDILSYSGLVHSELEMQPRDVEQLIHEIIALSPALDSASVDITVDGPLPRVLANKAALTQVISNLLCNAVKFVAPGVRPRVRVWGTVAAGVVELWFVDNGIGIPKDSQAQIFKIFVRLNRPDLYEGTGIGLAIVRKAAERMGGSVGLESEEGKGSRFWVRLATGDAS